ncbi:hypothetical protein AMECASPLE_033543 [Ameca splendens]|uniref:Uncharacterized protein n=1 Tax=Ameca splendens TaxID=208324 RepID=A0ABV0ZRQ8_9TELE
MRGYCRSFLQPPVAGRSWKKSAWLWRLCLGRRLLAVTQSGRLASQQVGGAGTERQPFGAAVVRVFGDRHRGGKRK